jgi:hypothetical protein
MSTRISSEEIENKLSLVIRKPQEGKTLICITSIINDLSKNIHIVLTMNTLSSGMQFFARMCEKIDPSQIIVFNSKKKTAGDCHHATEVTRIFSIIEEQQQKKNPIKVIVCCAHTKRIHDSLPMLFQFAEGWQPFNIYNIKFNIHIDEAHAYIPPKKNRKQIKEFNASPIVESIIGYTATSETIWSENKEYSLFFKIHIRDIETELGIGRSESSFGLKDVEITCYNEMSDPELIRSIPCDIPEHIISIANTETKRKTWYDDDSCFDLGNEMLLLGFINFMLPMLDIAPDKFSYHFVPAFKRKVTHYMCMEFILNIYLTANVIVINGDGFQLFKKNRDGRCVKIMTSIDILEKVHKIMDKERRYELLTKLQEPSGMIQHMITDFSECPTFITGFTCIGMSVTLINPEIGNFDNVIYSHEHFPRDIKYQLCRFLFNYHSWNPESREKIKKTHIHSLKESFVETIIEYEVCVDRMNDEFVGKSCSLREIKGLEPYQPTYSEERRQDLNKINIINKRLWKKFTVNDEDDVKEQWERANQFYEGIRGKRIMGNSMPKKDDGNYYNCAISENTGVQLSSKLREIETSKEKWDNRFRLIKNQLNYAHVFVGYERLDNPFEYTIFIKYVQLEDTPETREILLKYGK